MCGSDRDHIGKLSARAMKQARGAAASMQVKWRRFISVADLSDAKQ